MIISKVFTKKALEIISKKLKGKKLAQQDSNYLSRFVRPKLRGIAAINANWLLKKLEYNQKALSIERKIKKLVLKNIKNVEAIIICGSAIQTNYKGYNDIDVIIVTKLLTKSLKQKNELINEIEQDARRKGINLDIQIYSKKALVTQYPHSPSLIYQLKDSKIIYGKLIIAKKIEISNLDLKMKLDWSEGLSSDARGEEIYFAIRNALLVLLLMNKKVDNYLLRENMLNILGYNLLNNLKNNNASNTEKKLALAYLNLLTKYLEDELGKPEWEKIKLEAH